MLDVVQRVNVGVLVPDTLQQLTVLLARVHAVLLDGLFVDRSGELVDVCWPTIAPEQLHEMACNSVLAAACVTTDCYTSHRSPLFISLCNLWVRTVMPATIANFP